MKITILRFPRPTCTPGIMSIHGEVFGHTLELPWKDNQVRVSCIPTGEYPISITWSPRFGRNLILVREVPGRAGIRIHGANRAEQLRGCVAVAMNRPTPDTIQGDLSGALLELVDAALKRGETVSLEILDPNTNQVEKA